jgi:hypothetical protein
MNKAILLLPGVLAFATFANIVMGAPCYDDGKTGTTMYYTGQGGACGAAPACSGTITLSYAMRDESCPSGTAKDSYSNSNVPKNYYNEYYGCTKVGDVCQRNSTPSSTSPVVTSGTVIRCTASGNACPTPTPDPTPKTPE